MLVKMQRLSERLRVLLRIVRATKGAVDAPMP